MPYRASVRHDRGARSPAASGSRAESGSRTSSKESAAVIDARRESLRSITVAVNPGVPAGTRNPRIPSSVPAHTTATSATDPLVIHILVPVSTQSRSEEHTSELQSRENLVCRLLLSPHRRGLHSFPTRRSSDLGERGGDRRPQGELAFNHRGREPGGAGGDEEPPDPLFGARPHHGHVGD